MVELHSCWRIWSEVIDNESVIYGVNDKNSFYLTSRVTHYEECEGGAIAKTLDGPVKLNGEVTRLKASEGVFRNIQTGLPPDKALQTGRSTTPLAAANQVLKTRGR